MECFHIIYSLLDEFDTGLSDTCKEFHAFKKYKLNSEFSLTFYRDVSFRAALSYIKPSQLSLNLRGCDLTDVSHLNHIHALDLSYSTVSDVSSLTDVHSLNLTRCKILKVGALKNCHTLILQGNGLVHDVSELGNVTHLDLSHCHGIQNVDALGHVHELSLYNCHGIHDIHALTHNHILNVARCHNITDFTSVLYTPTLDVSWCKIKDVSMFKHVKKLKHTKLNHNHRVYENT
jgi:hypothetical protein